MNRTQMIEYYITLIPVELFNDNHLTKIEVENRLKKLSTKEIEWEIKLAEKTNSFLLGWD